MNFVRNVLILAAGVFLAALIVPGIEINGRWDSLMLVVVILALFNAVVKPLLVLFALPFIILSMGLGLWLINALLLYWSAHLVHGFEVQSFWAALLGAFVISFTNMMLSGRAKPRSRRGPPPPPQQEPPRARGPGSGEVIDIE
jgi:putative membrane protein